MWTPVWIVLAAVVGGAAGTLVRAAVFHHSVEAGQPWRTACPECDAAIVPTGWRLATRPLRPTGRCPACGTRIGPPPWTVEVATAAVFGLIAWRIGWHPVTPALAWAGLIGVALGFVDLAAHRLPDRLIATALAGTLAGFVLATALGDPPHRLLVAVACAAGTGLVYFVIVFVGGMGLGDAKLALMVGLATGWFGVGVVIDGVIIGFILSGLTALTLLALRRVSRKDRIAHGPFMLLGALAAILLAHG